MTRWLWLLLIWVGLPLLAAQPDCPFIKKELDIYRSFAPSGISVYKSDLEFCNINLINRQIISDYYNTEFDTLLSYVYWSFQLKKTHPLLIQYMVRAKRWDLLLLTLDMLRDIPHSVQISVLNEVFYENIPLYFSAEIKELFNFFTDAEKLTISQQLIPNSPHEIKHLNKRNNYIYEFWPLFDQMVYINHLRELYPNQFDKLALFWKETLVSFYYEGVENQNPSFKLLSRLLNNEVDSKPVIGADPSLQAYYYLKINDFDNLATILNSNKTIIFNLLRYYDLFTAQQQRWLLESPIELNLSDIERLFSDYFYQIESPSFRSWVWDQAISASFNLETYFNQPNYYLLELTPDKKAFRKQLAPILYAVEMNESKINHLFELDPTTKDMSSKLNNDQLSNLSRFYNDYQALPFRSTSFIMQQILPYIKVDNHQQFINLIPYISFEQQLNMISLFPFLEIMPKEKHNEWNKVYKSWIN